MPTLTPAPPPLTEGERWSRDLLDRLREHGFTPLAWRDFLAASFRRARVIRARRPEVVRQSRRWGALGLAAALPFGRGPTLSWVFWWAMIDWHVGMLETPDGRPRPLTAADALTLTRLWAGPVLRRHPEPWLVAAFSLTDLADGPLARAAGPSRFGRDFDSTADTVLLAGVLRGAVETRGLDPRLLIVERARLVTGGAVSLWSWFGGSAPPPALHNRELAAGLAGVGGVLAVAGRTELAKPLLAAAIGSRLMIRMRGIGSGPR